MMRWKRTRSHNQIFHRTGRRHRHRSKGVEQTIGPGTEKVESSTLANGHMLMPWIMWSLVSREPLRLPFAVFRSCKSAESGIFWDVDAVGQVSYVSRALKCARNVQVRVFPRALDRTAARRQRLRLQGSPIVCSQRLIFL